MLPILDNLAKFGQNQTNTLGVDEQTNKRTDILLWRYRFTSGHVNKPYDNNRISSYFDLSHSNDVALTEKEASGSNE